MRFPALVAPLALIVFALAFAAPGAARADDAREESRAAFRRGVAAIEKQDWATARTELEHAYTLYAHPSILLDLGLARARTEAWVLAETALVGFLAEDQGAAADEVETARKTLAEVKSHLGTLHVKVDPASAKVTVDGEAITLVQGGTADVRVVLGQHKLHAEAPEHAALDQTVPVTLQGGEATLTLVSIAPDDQRGPSPQKLVGFSLVGVGAVSLGIGIFAGVRALDLAHQYSTASEANYQNPDTKSTGITFRTLADVTLIGGALLVAGGVVLVLLAPKPGKPPPALAVVVRTVTGGLAF